MDVPLALNYIRIRLGFDSGNKKAHLVLLLIMRRNEVGFIVVIFSFLLGYFEILNGINK